MSVATYLRVSTAEQANEGISLDAQRAKASAYIAMRGLESPTEYEDAGVSASIPIANRPAGGLLMADVASGRVKAVVAVRLERIFRDCVDCLMTVRSWDKIGVALHLIDLGGQTLDTSTAIGRFFLTVMSGAAELERNLGAERTTAALAHLRAEGIPLGAVPFGKIRGDDVDAEGRRTITTDLKALAIVERALALRKSGASYSSIAAQLNAGGHKAAGGGEFSKGVIWKILKREEAACRHK